MVKDETYYFHQTPEELCKKLIEKVPLEEGDKVLEPFKPFVFKKNRIKQ